MPAMTYIQVPHRREYHRLMQHLTLCNCEHKNECPDCICEKGETAVECPTCPTCPEAPECPKLPDKGTGTIVKDILDGIFPGKNR